MLVATHSGPFHCDDVFASALLRSFLAPDCRVVRTRDLARIAEADIAIDVGGEYDPARGRFDHHQRAYEGSLSSAGMVLAHLEAEGHVGTELAQKLRSEWVEYIDAVDVGRHKPSSEVPCLPRVIGALCEQAHSPDEFDARYEEAVQLCTALLSGLKRSQRRTEEARAIVKRAMLEAERAGTRIITLEQPTKWKRAYFEAGGANHPTDFVLMPDGDRWLITAIPPEHESFENKRSLPEAWAGLIDDELSTVIGVPDARFCHKNRFIAVFGSRASAETAIERWGLAQRS